MVGQHRSRTAPHVTVPAPDTADASLTAPSIITLDHCPDLDTRDPLRDRLCLVTKPLPRQRIGRIGMDWDEFGPTVKIQRSNQFE